MISFKFISKENLSRLPKSPGVYAFKKERQILYIGKAGNLRERVKNHFQQPAFRGDLFINQATKIGYIKTDSKIEALILEANLIKRYQPKYNVVWRDDKNYFYIGITRENYPRVFITHQPKVTQRKFKSQRSKVKISIQNPKFVGPFVDGKSLKATLKVLRKVFPYRSCIKIPSRPCLWYQLNRCPAPCLIKFKSQRSKVKISIQNSKFIQNFTNKIRRECRQNAKNISEILRGKKNKVVESLKREMKNVSVGQDFERAAKIRDQIWALERILAYSKIFGSVITQPWSNYQVWKDSEKKLKKILRTGNKISRIEAYDVSNIQGQNATGSMVTFVNGEPDKNFYRRFKIKISGEPNDIAMLKEIISRRFQHPEWGWPDLILIDGGKAQLNVATECLKWRFKHVEFKHVGVIALAKKENKLFIENKKKPVLLKNLPREVFNLILQLRDEAHRFAISYHRKLREKLN